MKKISLISLSLLVLVGGCSFFDKKEEKVQVNASSPLTATAKVIGANNESYGNAYFQEEDNGVMMTLALSGLPPGTHGIHIHEVGKCEPPKFESAGAHFNPTKKEHGKLNPNGYHLGDLPNLEVGDDGNVDLNFLAEGLTLQKDQPNSLLDSDGSSIVIHESADDYKTDPAGNSGARIACGVIQ
ncbi:MULTISPECIES: superoxide dismutase family protein [Bacteria]|uniref:Superoxide dismutase [Cu-Zn] n=1 Tax=Lysinibacillus fusiformis TaxID=28031 RepID=A0A1H9HRB3_9BACI|nr:MULTISPECIES: superoxide dismutase family protein [Lysinibacillus]EAZ86306.1 putative superoxide dismutase (Cu/Zn) [Bacillus sp. B14905]HAU35751.1 superoxide dismutase family protein [Lysinibacillus sp.]MCG7433575.1 superoxide dismutase family protein [Lysinibacillus fusiformis]MED4078411.1 superoxide dismutase family protein [Lysinibacillus fusiformis]MED4667944.1 superoxide dismutase family protein [Lysinibacillus fusiformis]